MRTNLDFTPFYRSSVGFDRMFNLLENASRIAGSPNLPSYDIVRKGEDAYRVMIAVPGYAMENLEITQQPNTLVVTGSLGEEAADGADYLHRGIERRSFVHRFEIADHVEIVGAELVNGMLTIDLKREIPEALKPRKIQINAPQQTRRLENKAA
jgi:molecular chaperone IbpA